MDHGQKLTETHRLLGEVSITLSGHDSLFEHLFLRITGLEHEMGATIYLATDGTGRRRQLLDAVAKVRFRSDPSKLSEWESIRAEHAALYERRNRLMHDVWALNVETGDYMLVRQYPPNKGFTIDPFFFGVAHEDLKALVKRGQQLSQRIVNLMVALTESTLE